MENVNEAESSANASAQAQTPSKSYDKSKELQLLKYSLNRIKDTFSKLGNPLTSPNNLQVNTIGLSGIILKFNNGQYNSLDEYLTDIKALARSYSIHFAHDPRFKNLCRDLMEWCDRDVKSIRKCSDCFESWGQNPNDYFTNVCTKPHLIVYAKLDKFPFWPAKVLEVYANLVNVEFFGDHTQSEVSVQNCILYAKSHSNINKKRDDAFNHAKKELDIHIKKIEKRFGKIVATDKKVLISPQNYEQQRKIMFPGAFKAASTVTGGKSSDQGNVPTMSKELVQVPKSPNTAAFGTPPAKDNQSAAASVALAKVQKSLTMVQSPSSGMKSSKQRTETLRKSSIASISPNSTDNKDSVAVRKSLRQSNAPMETDDGQMEQKRRSNKSSESLASQGDSVEVNNPSDQNICDTPSKKSNGTDQKRKATVMCASKTDDSICDATPTKKLRRDECSSPEAIGIYVKAEFEKLEQQNDYLEAENRRLNRELETLELVAKERAERNEKLKKIISKLKKTQGAKCAFCLGEPKNYSEENSDD